MSIEEAAERSLQEFEARERERATIRESIEPILASIAAAGAALPKPGVFSADERYHLGQSRVELLRVLQLVEQKSATPEEQNSRTVSQLMSR
jgi:hypothetical protein